jgi:hypothetical protein
VRDQIDCAAVVGFIGIGAEHATWFEQKDVDHRRVGSDGVSGDHNVVLLGIHPCGKCIDNMSIDMHIASEDQLFAGSSRSYACCC